MGKLNLRIESFRSALKTLQDILKEEETVIVRDAAIQRFEYTFEAMWKALKFYLEEMEGITSQTPKACFRAAFQSGLLTVGETETCLEMTDSRNMTSHAYIEAVAAVIYGKIPSYVKVMSILLKKISNLNNGKFRIN